MASHEYVLRGRFPFDDVEAGAVARAAEVLGVPVDAAADGGPEVRGDGLLVFADLPDDADEVAEVSARIGSDFNGSVVFWDLSYSDAELQVRANLDVMRVSVSFAAVLGVRAVLLEEDSDNAVVLTVQDGRVVLNQDWDGWRVWPDVLSGVPRPYEMRPISLR